MALLILIPRWNKKIPAGLIVLFGSIALSVALNLSANFRVEIVGELPQGLPSLSIPDVSWTALPLMILPAIGVLLVAFSRGAGLVAWVAVILTLLFLTPLFTNLPETILAALILHALWHIIASRKLHTARLVSRPEFVLGLLTFAGVIFFGVLQGMLVGLVSALLLVLYRSSRAHLSQLGKVPDETGAYSDISRHPENITVPGLFIVRLDAPMYYANALTVRDRVMEMIKESDQPVKAVLFDAAVQDALDITTSNMLKGLIRNCIIKASLRISLKCRTTCWSSAPRPACSIRSVKIVCFPQLMRPSTILKLLKKEIRK